MASLKVTVGIPVYNSAHYLAHCLDSILHQTIGKDGFEIVAVDDGSTDESAQLLEEYSDRHPNIRVFRQSNTGGPGAPRNRIIDEAKGEFIFFVDADDYLGPHALERMYGMGAENNADIVMGKFVGVNGRGVATSLFDRNRPHTDVYESDVFEAIGPTKMFRRQFLLEHGIRFPERIGTAEDQPFMVLAYMLAKTISIVADTPCYYVVNHTGKEHASVMPVEPEQYYATLEKSLRIIVHHVRNPEKQAPLIANYLKKELTTGRSVNPGSPALTTSEKDHWMEAFRRFIAKWADSNVLAHLPADMQQFITLADRQKLADSIDLSITTRNE